MFRFDFRDKSLIPPILGTDNADYLERLMPVLERERIHPSGVVRLRDAAFCEERGIVQLSSSAEHTALLENEELEAEAIRRMAALNKEIAAVEDLNENYQIGASYFLKLKTLDFDQLWTDYLQPLLQEYIQGMYDEEGIMKRFAKAYGYQRQSRGDVHEATQDQG